MGTRALHESAARVTDAGIQWGRRPERRRLVALTARDLQLFGWLEQTRYLTTRMIGALLWAPGTGLDVPQRRLKLLHDAGLLDKFRPPSAAGSREWTYRLTADGWDALVDAGLARTSRLPVTELHYLGYVEHDLQLTGTLLDVAAAAWPGALPIAARLPIRWDGPDSGRVNPAAETQAHHPSAEALATDALRLRPGTSRSGILEPDATWLGVHAAGGGRDAAVLFEYDRTRRPSKQVARWQRYDRFLSEGWVQSRFAAHFAPPGLIYLLSDDSLLPTFLREADRHVTAAIGTSCAPTNALEWPGREQLAFTSRERLHAGDWTMWQLPAHPPDVRGRGAFRAREVLLPIPRLFACPCVSNATV